jgi:hypothetical protein
MVKEIVSICTIGILAKLQSRKEVKSMNEATMTHNHVSGYYTSERVKAINLSLVAKTEMHN